MANTFHWTLPNIYKVTIREMNKLIEKHNEFIERQNKETQKGRSGRSGKTSIGSLGQLKNLPGIKTIKRKR